jgi:hypothetical protein
LQADFSGAGTYAGYHYDKQSQSGTAGLIFTLTAGESNSFQAQVGVQSVLDNTRAASIPLQSAFWLFFSGLLGFIGCKKHRPKSPPEKPGNRKLD